MNTIISTIISFQKRIVNHYERSSFRASLGFCDKTAKIAVPLSCSCPRKIFLRENTSIYGGANFIINPEGDNGNFIMKKNSGSARGLTVITGNHQREIGHLFKDYSDSHLIDDDKDVIVEEDVWIGANVTLLSGVTVGRGATIGAGSVCFKSIPPYAVVLGNPAKIVGFNFSPEEIIEHERCLYSEEERLPIGLLEKNYKKYFLDKITEIKSFTKL